MTPRVWRVVVVVALLLTGSGAIGAQNTITVSGNPALLRISSAVAGSEPIGVSSGTTTYTVSVTSGGTRRITGRLSTALPPGVTVTVTLAAPAGATSMGAVVLDLTEKDLVINIPRPTTSTHAITYQLTATVSAGVIPLSSQIVTLRLRV
jgi:hypothetical protein